MSGSTVTLTLGTDVNYGDDTQVSYQSSTATLKDVDEGGKTVSITDSTVALYAVDDTPIISSSDVATNGQSIVVSFSEAIDSVSATDLSFIVNSSAVTPNGVSDFL